MAKADDLDLSIDGFSPVEFQRERRFNSSPVVVPQPPVPSSAYDTRFDDAPAPREPRREPAPEPEPAEAGASEDSQARRPRERRRDEQPRRDREVKARRPAVLRFFTDERTRVFLGITLMLLALFLLISIFSYFRHGATDQSEAINSTITEMAQHGEVQNVTGGIGAKVSHWLMCDTLGLGSIVTIVYFVILALGLFGLRKCNFWSTTFKCLLLALTLSMVLGLATFNSASAVYWGGNHGHYMNKLLIDTGTWLTALGVSVLLVCAVCCVYLNELRRVWHICQAAAERRRQREELRRERQRELQNLDDEEDLPENASTATETGVDTHHQGGDPVSRTGLSQPAPVAEPATMSPATVAEPTPVAQPAAVAQPIPVAESAPVAEPLPSGQQPTIIEEGFSIVAPEIEVADVIPDKPADDGLYDHRADLSRYRFPTVDLLEDRPSGPSVDVDEQQANKERIVQTLLQYRIPISRIEATVGPTVTLYEVVPAEGVRIAQIKNLEDDIAMSLSALGIRIIAPIPGKGTVGIEVPNSDPRTVSIRSVITSKKYQETKMALPMAMGATISNEIFIADLTKMPHLLVAGATGMGKSVGLNTIIASLLYKKHPSELKFVLIDPKMVEFSLYSKLERHFLAKLPGEDDAIITDMDKVLETLNSLCVEMDQRYELLRQAGVRALDEYNRKFTERRLNPEKGHRYLPYIVVIVDEFADILMTKGKEVETPIARIAQKARAVGIHMILATQRPSTNVITGLIKANFPGRIAFRVIQMVDSRTILDRPGANQLIGRGDMLFSHNGSMERVQCAFISTEEVESITQYIDDQVGYEHAYYLPEPPMPEADSTVAGAGTERDPYFDEAARFVVSRQLGSTSSLQRQFGIGYNRAGKLIDQMEMAGIVGPINGSKPRAILVDMVTLERILQG